MSITTKIKIFCKRCNNEFETITGLEDVAFADKGIIIPLCRNCSEDLRRDIREHPKNRNWNTQLNNNSVKSSR